MHMPMIARPAPWAVFSDAGPDGWLGTFFDSRPEAEAFAVAVAAEGWEALLYERRARHPAPDLSPDLSPEPSPDLTPDLTPDPDPKPGPDPGL